MLIESLEGRRFLSASGVELPENASPVALLAHKGEVAAEARKGPGTVAALARAKSGGGDEDGGDDGGGVLAATSSQGGQSNFPPGQFPAGNPAKAPGNSNSPGNSRK